MMLSCLKICVYIILYDILSINSLNGVILHCEFESDFPT